MSARKARKAKPSMPQMVMGHIRSGTLFLSGSHPDEVKDVSPAETRNLKVDGAMLSLSMLINAAIWSAALLSAGKPWWVALPIAALICVIIGLFDRQFLSASISMDGEELAKQRQEVGFFPISPRRKVILTSARIVLSFASMWAAVLLLRVSLFSADVDAHLADQYRLENEGVRATATQLVDQQIEETRSQFVQAQEERDALYAQQRSAESRADTPGIDEEIASLRAEISASRGQLQELSRERSEHLRGATAEDAGVQERANDSGIPGQGTRWEFHRRRAEDIRNQMNLTLGLIRTAENRITELQESKRRQVEENAVSGAREAEVLAPRLQDAEERIASLNASLRQLESDRPSQIASMMTRDPNHSPAREGLLVRVEALNDIAAGSWSAWAMSFAITLVCSVLELAVVWYRVILGMPHPAGYSRVQSNLKSMETASLWGSGSPNAQAHETDPDNDNSDPHRLRSA